MIEIPWQQLDHATLDRLLDEIVTRDGTDYGWVEVSYEARRSQALENLKQGRARLVWDEESATASLRERLPG